MSNEERSDAQGRPVTAAGNGQGQAQGAAGGYHDDVLVPEAAVEDRRYRWLPSLIWLLPLLAALVGAILTYRQMTQHGPTITVSFKTAEGLEAGKTKLRYKDVEVGQVKSIELADDRSHVEVDIELNRKAGSFRAKDSRYWVVRPRADISGVSGLGTLLSGAYIGVDAGKSAEMVSTFEGLESPPPLKYDEAGSQFRLRAKDLGSLDIGSPVLYRRVTVGRVTGYSLDESGDRVTIDVFVNSPYDRFVGTNSRFWEASGVEAKLDSSGVSVRTQSLLTVALGGIAFASPIEGKGEAANEHTAFMLAASEADAMKKPDGPSRFLVLNFDQSLRGLQVGAIVDFRGVELGQVRAIDAVVDENTNEIHMPVLIEVFSDRMKRGRGLQAQGPLGAGMTQKELEEEGNRWLQNMVQRGLRAQLRTGNLLTGQLYVSLDFFPQAKPAEMRSVQGDLMELPTVGNSLDEFQQQIAEILAKINKVPFDQIGRDLQRTLAGMRRTVNAAEKTVKGLNDNLAPQLMGTIQSLKKTLDSADRTLVSANRTLASDSPTQEELQQTLRSVSKAADSLRRLTDYLERHPESLLRGKTGN